MSNSTENVNYSIEEIITLRKSNSSDSNTVLIANNEINLDSETIINQILEPDTILCLLWHNNVVGGAYYKISDKQLYVLNDISDTQPGFLVTKTILREVCPRYLITIGNTCQSFVKCLIDCLTNEENTINSDQPRAIPPNMSLLSYKEYLIESCVYKIREINLRSAPETRQHKEVYLNSMINFSNEKSTHALGALLKFLEQYWSNFCPNENELKFIHINQITITNHVLMDNRVFKALQVFQSVSHNASFKHGTQESNYREGLSIFKLFSQHIKSKVGLIHLRNILANPINDVNELNKRLNFIEFATMARNQGLIDSLRNNIKNIYDLQFILGKIDNMRATRQNWENLYTTIVVMLQINEICSPYASCSNLLMEFSNSITMNLYGLQKSINLSLDFNENIRRKRPVIKFGLDTKLDAKKLKLQDIAKSVTTASHFAVDNLPSYIDSCMVVHVPEMGYLVAIKEWGTNCDKEQLNSVGFQFMFEMGGFLHYKNAMCKELDKLLGNLYDDIVAHENRIINRLRGFVMKYDKDIRDPLRLIALIDCLISMATIAKENNYVRPTLNNDNIHAIEDGKHPLLEDSSTSFVPNDYYTGGNHGRIKIITGPNASGKSIYLKQTAIIIYLAHVGSFLPAKKASIGMMHGMHCRLQATESASIRLSAFMIDIQQMSQTFYNSRSNRMIIIDEFGRGTTGWEGEALHAAALKHFISQENNCPNVLVSTHFQRLSRMLPESNLIIHMRMNYTIQDKQLIFLYKISEGIATSFAFDVAESLGFDDDILSRAKHIFDCLKNNTEIKPDNRNIPMRYRQESVNLTEFLMDINIPEPDD